MSVARQSSSQTYSISLPPGYYNYKTVLLVGASQVSGHFSESQGQPVTFYIFNQQELDTYKAGGGAATYIFSVSNTASGTYQANIGSAGTYYLVTISGSSQTEQVIQNFTLTQTSLPYYGLESLTGIGFAIAVVARRVRVRENRRTIASILKENPAYGPGQGEADDQILSSARDLCRQLGFEYEPLRLSWITWIPTVGVRRAPSDLPLIGVKGKAHGTVFMPAILRKSLEPKEWTPLIASSLIHGFNASIKPRRTRLRWIWLVILVTILSADLTVFSLLYLFPIANFSGRLILDLLLPVLLIAGGFILTFSTRKLNVINRHLLLDADRITSQIVGKEQLLQTLKKIDAMKLSDNEQRNKEKPTIWKKNGVLPFPSLMERIQQLDQEPMRGFPS